MVLYLEKIARVRGVVSSSNGILNHQHILCPSAASPLRRGGDRACRASRMRALQLHVNHRMSHSKRIRDSGSRRKSLFLADPQSDSGPEDDFNPIELVRMLTKSALPIEFTDFPGDARVFQETNRSYDCGNPELSSICARASGTGCRVLSVGF